MSDGAGFSELNATRMQRANQICNRFESAWRSGERPSLAEHLKAAEPHEQPVVARMLIELDLDYRRMHGETPSAEDYRSLLSFPAAWLEPLVRGALDATRVDRPADQETPPRHAPRPAVRGKAEMEQLPRVLGDYLLLERIGGGGMGVVYKAQHQHMKRIVAVKLIRGDEADTSAARQRFQREVEAAARLHHPYIVTAHDARVEQGVWCLITEYVAGRDLARVVKDSGPLALPQALHCVCQAAEALAYAHAQGIIHRDIKPANLLLDQDGNVKVLDMGLARLQEFDADPQQTKVQERLTQTGFVVGTVDFMSPEQARNSAQADERSDIYSLGCTLYYLLTGSIAYRGTTVMETLLAHREQPIPSLSSVRPEVPPELEAIFQRMLAKQPGERYQSMSEVLSALQSVAKTLQAKPPRPADASHSSASLHTTGRASQSESGSIARRLREKSKPAVRQRSVLYAAGGVLALVCLWGVSRLWSSEDSPVAEPQPRPQERSSAAPAEQGSAATNDAEKSSLVLLTPANAAAEQAAAAKRLGLPVATTGTAEIPLRLIPAHRLAVAARTLSIPSPLYFGATEVTVAQFRRFVDATGHQTDAERSGGWGMRDGNWIREQGFSWKNLGSHPMSDDMPAVNLSWNDAVAFCEWLTAEPDAGGRYRLPTEIEWALACRAGSTAAWFFGDDPHKVGEYAWYQDTSGMNVHPVARKSPNPFGLHDMLGNENEWCADLFEHGTTLRVQRGGSFSHTLHEVSSSARWGEDPRSPNHGAMRVVREISP